MNITTTNGETFTYEQHADLAAMVYHRFGRDVDAATAAWCRMMQNNTSTDEFKDLLINAASRLEQNHDIAHILRRASNILRGISYNT